MKYDKYIGFDLHQATTAVAVLDAEGKVVSETIVATEEAAVIRLLLVDGRAFQLHKSGFRLQVH